MKRNDDAKSWKTSGPKKRRNHLVLCCFYLLVPNLSSQTWGSFLFFLFLFSILACLQDVLQSQYLLMHCRSYQWGFDLPFILFFLTDSEDAPLKLAAEVLSFFFSHVTTAFTYLFIWARCKSEIGKGLDIYKSNMCLYVSWYSYFSCEVFVLLLFSYKRTVTAVILCNNVMYQKTSLELLVLL